MPLFLLWKHSFESGTIDQSYRSQLIAPIFKGGSKLDPANYRPVSLTSHIIKIFERVLQSKIVQYLEENNLLSKSQHGFRKGCSCLSELLAHFNHLYENLGSCHDTDTIYLDFSKAFDKVDHALLIKKLQLYGIKGKLLRWIKSFLSNRVQKVVVNGKVSVVELVISGVPQGTVLGPLLFLLFVNDIELYIENSHLKLFADDSRLFKKIHPSSSPDGSECLQNDLDNVCRWATANNMVLNETKFQLLSHHVHSHAPNNNMRMLQQLPLVKEDIQRAHRVGRRKKPSVDKNGKVITPKPRQIIVKLKDYGKRQSIIKNKRNFQENAKKKNVTKFQNSFIVEDLTPLRSKLLWYAKHQCNGKFKNCHTKNGRILAQTSESEKWIDLSTPDHFHKHGVDVDIDIINDGLRKMQILKAHNLQNVSHLLQ